MFVNVFFGIYIANCSHILCKFQVFRRRTLTVEQGDLYYVLMIVSGVLISP